MAVGKDKVRFYVTMPKDLKLLLEKRAQEENRSVSNYIVTVLQKYIEGHPN
jgi:metal-responsive CopG/Arc/MetJ family transcriptional regulator